MSKEGLAAFVLNAFKVGQSNDLIDDFEARDLIAFSKSKACDTLCKVLSKIARLEVEGSAECEEGFRAVGIGKAEAMFQLLDHIATLQKLDTSDQRLFDKSHNLYGMNPLR